MSSETALILVVDDNEMNRDMLSRRLQRQKYEVLMAENGEQALQMVREHPFDLVLLDIMMPTLSGYEVLERLKADDATHHIPVIMISAVDDLDSVVKCISLGAEDYLFKPFNPVLLKARVSASIKKHQGISASQVQPHLAQMRQALDEVRSAGELSPEHQPALEKIQQHLVQLENLLIQE